MISSSAHADDSIAAFEKRVEKAMASVKRVLNADRRLHVVDHNSIDKYKLVDLLVNSTIIALMNALERLGLTKEILRDINSKAVTLRFECSESRTSVKEYDMDQTLCAEESQESTSEPIVKRVIEQHFEVKVDWELSICSGTDLETRKVIMSRNGTEIYIRNSRPRRSPRSPTFPTKTWKHEPIELPLAWLLQQIDANDLKPHFSIDTSLENTNTQTPCRNAEIQDAISFAYSLMSFARRVCLCLQRQYQKYNVEAFCTFEGIDAEDIPLMSNRVPGERLIGNEGESDRNEFLEEQDRILTEMAKKLQEEYPDPEISKLVSSAEAMTYALFRHMNQLMVQFVHSIDHIEHLLAKQLVAADEKNIDSQDLDKFMRYVDREISTFFQVFAHSSKPADAITVV